MARQWTAKQAIDAQNGVTTPVTPSPTPVAQVAPTTPTPINTSAPALSSSNCSKSRRSMELWYSWQSSTREKPTVAPTQPTPTVKPASASQAIAQGFKQGNKTSSKGAMLLSLLRLVVRQKLGQLPTVQQAQNQAEQDRINTANLKGSIMTTTLEQSWDYFWCKSEPFLNDHKAFNKAFGYDNKDVSEKSSCRRILEVKKTRC